MALNVWVVRDAEPLPSDPGSKRLMRDGMLCAALVARGHRVTWLTSSFDHYSKQYRPGGVRTIRMAEDYSIEVLPGYHYTRNVSLQRLLHNWLFARAVRRFARSAKTRPDVIVTDIPTTDSALAAIELARQWGIPSIVSIRDLWPDFFEPFIPPALRLPAKPFLSILSAQARRACAGATAIVGISEQYLAWGLAKAHRQRGAQDAVIPLGYPADAVAMAPATLQAETFLRSLGIKPSQHVVSFIGSWGRTYDLQTVIDAIRHFQNRGDVKFVIAGDGEQRAALAAAIAADPAIVAPGWLSREQIAWLLRRSAVGLMPYVANAPQGLPNKIFEYLAYGVFQVSTLGGEASSLLAELGAGVSCPPENASALAEAITKALETAGNPELKSDLRAKFSARYDAASVYDGFVDYIERLARR